MNNSFESFELSTELIFQRFLMDKERRKNFYNGLELADYIALKVMEKDCIDGKVDLIITQKVSNVTKKPQEITILSRLLATLPHPVGIYFISEDIFTLASYYQEDMRDTDFFPEGWVCLPDTEEDKPWGLLHD